MAVDIEGATDELLGALKTAWDANARSTAVDGVTVFTPLLVYEPDEADLKPHPSDSDRAWARVVIRHGSTLKRAIGMSGPSRYGRTGILFFQAFSPNRSGAAWAEARALATIAQRAYEGKPSPNVQFLRASVFERGAEASWYRADMQMNFRWDEIK